MSDWKVDSPWSLPASAAAAALRTDLDRGLSSAEVSQRFAAVGPNVIETERKRTPLKILLTQFADLMIGLLAAAAVVSALVGEVTDAILIALIVVANAVIGFVQEWRAEKAVDALKQLSQPKAKVRRDGSLREVAAAELVPGDVIEVAAGDFVPADARVVSAVDLEVVEAALTGESLPVEKSADPLPAEAGLPDRRDMLHTGTAVQRGHGRALVTATGMATELGHIARLLDTADSGQTPLQRRLSALSKRLAIIVIVVCVIIFAAGILREPSENWDQRLVSQMLLTAVSLAVAAIPEGLPAVITVALALGSQRMAGRRAIVRRLSAVETLGSVDVICTDKTGTLTQNRMAAEDVIAVSGSDEAKAELLRAAILCNDAELSDGRQAVGSATESALLQAAIDWGLNAEDERQAWPRVAEFPFSSDRKRMTTVHRGPNDRTVIYTKGATERILERLEDGSGDSADWQHQADELASRGRRVIAVAARDWNGGDIPRDDGAVESQLRLLGLIGIVDPVRPEARDAIAACRSAGIKAVMITGDHKGTAKAIADDLDLWREGEQVLTGGELETASDDQLIEHAPETTVYARVSPEHKLRIVKAHQARGSVVAMTGDGVNDAPALRQAEIGVAMGVTGTDVAKEAGEMILADDNFATIVAAVEEGRVVYDNIRKFVAYLLTTNCGEILVLFGCIMLGMPLPLLPVHLLWINLVTDGLPALALGFEPAERDIMQRKPRKRDESLFAEGLGWGIILLGLLMAVCCILLFWWYLPKENSDPDQLAYARSLVFLTISMFQLFHVLAIRSSTESFFTLGLWSNYRLTFAVLLGTILQFAVIYIPAVQGFFHTVPLSLADALIGTGVATSIFIVLESWKAWCRLQSRKAS